MEKTLVYDIGGTDIKYGIIENGKFIEKGLFPTPKDGKLLQELIISKSLFFINAYSNVTAIGISTTGIFDPKDGIILLSSGTIPNFTGINLKSDIEKKAGIPVFIDNDVNSMALAEVSELNSEYRSVIALTIGTGIGGSIIIDNKVYHGSNFSAGEFGLMKINGKFFQDIASTASLVKSCQTIHNDIKNGIDCFKYYDNNDFKIVNIINTWYHNLSIGISNLVWALNPEVIIIGGGISARPTFITELSCYLEKELPSYFYDKLIIKKAHHQNDAGLIGAYLLTK